MRSANQNKCPAQRDSLAVSNCLGVHFWASRRMKLNSRPVKSSCRTVTKLERGYGIAVLPGSVSHGLPSCRGDYVQAGVQRGRFGDPALSGRCRRMPRFEPGGAAALHAWSDDVTLRWPRFRARLGACAAKSHKDDWSQPGGIHPAKAPADLAQTWSIRQIVSGLRCRLANFCSPAADRREL